jgi:phosphopantetheine adenylyltransferase
MMTIEERISALHATEAMVYLVCTGAGAGVQNLIAEVPGASATILECRFPYSGAALAEFLGEMPTRFASQETALRMAAVARRRGVKLAIQGSKNPEHVLGIGVTAAIATNRIMRGEHRVFVAVCGSKGFFITHAVFGKKPDGTSVLGRLREGELCDLLALNAILICAGVEPIDLPEHSLQIRKCGWEKDGGRVAVPDLDPDKIILFPGSFNPLHFGHEAMAQAAGELAGKRIVYLMNLGHPDKGTLGEAEVAERLLQFNWLAPIIVTHGQDLYVEKARAFQGFTFVVGADTLERILDPKYGVPTDAALREFAACHTRFMVASRRMGERTVSLPEILRKIPCEYRDMFEALPVAIDVSSSEIRKG